MEVREIAIQRMLILSEPYGSSYPTSPARAPIFDFEEEDLDYFEDDLY